MLVRRSVFGLFGVTTTRAEASNPCAVTGEGPHRCVRQRTDQTKPVQHELTHRIGECQDSELRVVSRMWQGTRMPCVMCAHCISHYSALQRCSTYCHRPVDCPCSIPRVPESLASVSREFRLERFSRNRVTRRLQGGCCFRLARGARVLLIGTGSKPSSIPSSIQKVPSRSLLRLRSSCLRVLTHRLVASSYWTKPFSP